jgi:replicative DNA helicase
MKRSEAGRGKAGSLKQKSTAPEVKIPHDAVNEQALIVSACLDRAARKRLVNAARSDGFYGKGHPEIWVAITELERQNLDYEPETVQQLGLAKEHADYLARLIGARPQASRNLQHHLDCFAWDQMRLEAAKGPVAQLIEAMRDPTTEPDLVRALARNVAGAFQGAGLLKYLRDQEQLLASMSRKIQKRRDGNAVYPFGIEGFDNFTDADGELAGQPRVVPGLAPGQLTLVTGVPGSGKSTFVLRMLGSMARQQRPTLMGSWEMESEYSLEVAGIVDLAMSRRSFQTGQITDEQEADHLERCRIIGSWVRFMDLPFGRTRGEKVLNDRNLDTIHSYIAETGAQVAVFDLFRRVMRQRDPDEEDAALERIQAIAQETGSHIVLVHQQRLKDLETRKDKRPTRETIKGSGGWVEMPDTIVGVHSPSLFKATDRETVELIMLKQRHAAWPWVTEHESDPERGWIGPGRGIEYVRPGESSGLDSWLDGDRSSAEQGAKKAGGRGRGSRKRANAV